MAKTKEIRGMVISFSAMFNGFIDDDSLHIHPIP